MGKFFDCTEQIIGRTPLIRLKNIEKAFSLKSNLFAKPEMKNPGGSVKDRAVLFMMNQAEKEGKLKQGSVIIEPTSGNTGVAIAMISAIRGYSAIIVIPKNASEERKKLIKAYGAELVLADGLGGMKLAIERASELLASTKNAITLNQFTNPANVEAHKRTTGREIFDDMGGKVDIFIAGVGSGGTLMGVGEFLKSRLLNVKIIAVEPKESAVLSGKKANLHEIQGIGAGFLPPLYNGKLVDEIITVSSEEAKNATRILASKEGIVAGISSGAALSAAIKVGIQKENKDKNIVTLLPDGGERYLSTDLFG